ncbi:MAG: NAD(P)-dependent oxidoreductase, partial [Promethearchaeota archaeon]
INTSRGKVIDQDALVKALEERRFAGAALDVFREEPVKPDDPILQLDNVVLTPHIASSTEENQVKAALIVAEKIADYLLNE